MQVPTSPHGPSDDTSSPVACRFGHGEQLFDAWHFNTHNSHSSTAAVPAGSIARLITITFREEIHRMVSHRKPAKPAFDPRTVKENIVETR